VKAHCSEVHSERNIPDLAFSLLAQLRDEVEFDVVGQHRADRVEVSGLEPLYILDQPGAHYIRQHRRDFRFNERFVNSFHAARDKQFVCPGDGGEQPEQKRTSRIAYCSKSLLPSSANRTNRFQSISGPSIGGWAVTIPQITQFDSSGKCVNQDLAGL
jgi:hypothetical protein